MTLQAVALVRIPGWEAEDELDVRELEDGALVFLELPFESEPDALVEALSDALGPMALATHDDERGVFVFPDAADPEDAATYDAVIEAVGELGAFVPLDADTPLGLSQDEAAEALQGALFGQLEKAVAQLGFGSLDEMKSLLNSTDPEAQKLAQIKFVGAIERSMAPLMEGAAKREEGAPDAPDAPSAPEKPKREG